MSTEISFARELKSDKHEVVNSHTAILRPEDEAKQSTFLWLTQEVRWVGGDLFLTYTGRAVLESAAVQTRVAQDLLHQRQKNV